MQEHGWATRSWALGRTKESRTESNSPIKGRFIYWVVPRSIDLTFLHLSPPIVAYFLDTLLYFISVMAMRRLIAGLSALACASFVTAIPGVTVEGVAKRASCAHGPTSRQCWGNYDINTDYATVTPDTGVTREVRMRGTSIILL